MDFVKDMDEGPHQKICTKPEVAKMWMGSEYFIRRSVVRPNAKGKLAGLSHLRKSALNRMRARKHRAVIEQAAAARRVE